MTITSARKFGLLSLMIFTCLLPGADLPGFKHYRVADLAGKDKELAPQDAKSNLSFLVLAKSPETGEYRAASIVGGEKRPIGPGDIIHIPAKMPHHVLVTRGQTVSYVIIKVKE